MKRFTIFLCMSLITLLGACGKSPAPQDVVGTWGNPDGATLTLDEKGQFSAHALPAAIFLQRGQPGPPLDAQGVWSLKKGEPYWEVKLRFGVVLGRQLGREITVLVSGSGASTYLYQWQEEEGGNRYKLDRKQTATH
jgi:hypothetical protein